MSRPGRRATQRPGARPLQGADQYWLVPQGRGFCHRCKAKFEPGVPAAFRKATREVICPSCWRAMGVQPRRSRRMQEGDDG